MNTDVDHVIRWILERSHDSMPILTGTGRLAMCGLALAGEPVDLGELVRITGRSTETIRNHLRPAIAGGFVLNDEGRYGLNAALFRTTA